MRFQNDLDPNRSEERKGSLEEFLRNFNAIENIHGADPTVSHDIVRTSADVLRELKTALTGDDDMNESTI